MEYKKVLADLKQNFGKLSYFNEKRKSGYRRIKIYNPSHKLKAIENFLKVNYPELKVGNTLKERKAKGRRIDHIYEYFSGVTVKIPL